MKDFLVFMAVAAAAVAIVAVVAAGENSRAKVCGDYAGYRSWDSRVPAECRR